MLRIHSVLSLAFVAALPLALGGCPAVAVVGGLAAAGGAGYEAAQERGVDGSYDDYAVRAAIENAWNSADPNLTRSFAVTVYDGRALLTGNSPDEGLKRRAFELASRAPGVRRVYDEIEIGNQQGGWDTAQDAWITTQVRKDLVFEKGIRSGNYTIETSNRSVYLMGSARSQEELDKAAYLARYVPGVKRVVSYVEIRSGVPVANGPPPPAAPGGNYGGGYNSGPSDYTPPSSGGASSAPIQVQKL
ncbi:MAG TPA: BON domain-containing protein [Stellaceae bacterium]|nr:BON domain-containing protein [Stellaceae bacterium]